MLSNIIEIPKPFVTCYENALRECTCTSMNQTARSKWWLQVRGIVGEVTNWQPMADVWRLSNTKTWNKFTRSEWKKLQKWQIYCVTQLMLSTFEKLSSPIFCCLSVRCQASVSPDQIYTYSNIYRHTSPLLTLYHLIPSITNLGKTSTEKKRFLSGIARIT